MTIRRFVEVTGVDAWGPEAVCRACGAKLSKQGPSLRDNVFAVTCPCDRDKGARVIIRLDSYDRGPCDETKEYGHG